MTAAPLPSPALTLARLDPPPPAMTSARPLATPGKLTRARTWLTTPPAPLTNPICARPARM